MEETLGDRVRRLRESKGMTQKELAKRTKLSHPSINEIETGVTVAPRRGTLIKLCSSLGVSDSYLKTGIESDLTEAHPAGKEPTVKVSEYGAADLVVHVENGFLREQISDLRDQLEDLKAENARLWHLLGKSPSSPDAAGPSDPTPRTPIAGFVLSVNRRVREARAAR